MTYSIRRNPDNTVTAILDNGEEVGPYIGVRGLVRDLEQINEHIEAGAWSGKAK